MTRRLADIAEVLMGQSPAGETCNEAGLGMPLLNGPTEFGPYNPSPTQYTTDPRKLADEGDLLFCVRGSTTGRMNWSDQRYAIGRGVAALRHRLGKSYQPWLRGVIEWGLPDLLTAATGSTFPNVSGEQLRHLIIPDHDIAEQQAIAATLGALDDKIELNRRTCATLEAMARALFRSWFVDFDPVHAKAAGEAPAHMDPADAALFPDRFGEDGLPEGWRMEPIGDATDIVGGSTPSTKNPEFWDDGAHLWATPRDLSRLQTPILLDTERRITDAGVAQISSRQLPPGTLLLSSRAPIGYLAIAQKPVSVNQGFIAIRETADLPSSYTLFWCRENMEAIVANANGSTFQEISKRNFRPLPVIVPPRAVMAAYRRIAEPLIAKIAANETESAALATLRDTLLPKLMSGEVRVRAAEAQVAGVA